MKSPTSIGGNNLILFLQDNTQFVMADLLTITLRSGPVLRYTTWEQSLIVNGNTFQAGPPHFKRTRLETKVGLAVSTVDLDVLANPTDLAVGVPILQQFINGAFDGAGFRIDRLFMDMNLNQVGTIVLFAGELGDVDEVGRTHAKLVAKSSIEQLNMNIPRNLIQAPCYHTLFDAGCTLKKANFAKTSSLQAGSTANKLLTALTDPDGFYDNGQLVFTSGTNSGLIKAIKSYFGGELFFNSPLPNLPNAGDALTVYPGCDKTQETCTNKFNNLVSFGGFPYVPVPEASL